MRPDLEQYYLIDQYLENKLTGEDLITFENQLGQDETFAQEVAEQRMLNGFILEAELKDVRIQMEKDLANIHKPSFFRTHWKWIGVGLLSISSILYVSLSSKEEIVSAVQESSVQSINNNTQPVLKATEQVTATNNIQEKRQTTTTVSETQVSQPNAIVTTTNNTAPITQTEVLTPTVTTPVTTTHTPAIETQSAEVAKTIDCSLTKISFSVTTETACSNTETGSIHIDKISGGVAPYSFTLNNKKIKEKNISELAAGTYEIKISDKNGCSTEHKATVLEKNCTANIQQGAKFNINPTIGETCSIPFNTDKKGNLTIYNRSGKIIHRETNPSTDYVDWNGTDGYGALAEAGLYVYIIEYTDGTKVTGEVNIIR